MPNQIQRYFSWWHNPSTLFAKSLIGDHHGSLYSEKATSYKKENGAVHN